jgi:hypothetical protein
LKSSYLLRSTGRGLVNEGKGGNTSKLMGKDK